ncbi:MAG: hypothetical protein QOE75_915 [Solirubrobacterales bacterium]|jgi:NAD(P)-dependent dehydrogenase (short-subunit alcohol dehydrogenase family)|nr:hypothetical protein [Solirubrobacterales bacterium]
MSSATTQWGIVTGAGAGIGRAVTTLLAEEGIGVVAGDLSLDSMSGLRDLENVEPVELDICEPASWQRAVESAKAQGGPAFLVNCAGIAVDDDTIEDCEPEAWRKVLDVNLHGAFAGTQAVAIAMRDSEIAGSIVHTSSVLGLVADGNTLAYGASKAAILGLVKSVALAVAPHQIRCNAILPGYIGTSMTERWIDRDGVSRQDLVDRHPLGRIGEPAEIARLVHFLVGPESAFITGAAVEIDGGYLAV